jgi:hypothetical protein
VLDADLFGFFGFYYRGRVDEGLARCGTVLWDIVLATFLAIIASQAIGIALYARL